MNGCNLVSKYHCFLTSAVKQMVLIHLSALCRTIDTDKGFLDNQMHASNFRDRMETARRVLFDHLLSADDPHLVAQLRQCQHHLQQISDSAAAASAEPSDSAVQAHGSCSAQSVSLFPYQLHLSPPTRLATQEQANKRTRRNPPLHPSPAALRSPAPPSRAHLLPGAASLH